jgi:hypothetical protein
LHNSGREDRIIAQAMRSVDIPDGLRSRVLARLRLERSRRRRTWPLRHPRWAAAAAVLLICSLSAFGYWWQRPLPIIDMDALQNSSQLMGQSDQVAMLFAERGWRLAPPRMLRYNFLISSGWELFQGKLVPRLLFEGNNGQIAEVFILSNRDFDRFNSPKPSGNIAVFSDSSDADHFFLVRFTGGSPDWVFNEEPQGA